MHKRGVSILALVSLNFCALSFVFVLDGMVVHWNWFALGCARRVSIRERLN